MAKAYKTYTARYFEDAEYLIKNGGVSYDCTSPENAAHTAAVDWCEMRDEPGARLCVIVEDDVGQKTRWRVVARKDWLTTAQEIDNV